MTGQVMLALAIAALLLGLRPAPAAPSARPLDLGLVWSGHPVGFCLLTEGERQFVAFYDARRRLTVAARRLDSRRWQLVRLPETLGWDSHNYVTMAADDEGYLHLSGNMHGAPLVYFRTTRPWDITTFTRLPAMAGRNEQHCTYPVFLRGPGGRLLFTYRDGSSGNGDQYYNVYDPNTRAWRRLLDTPLTSGEGQVNAYLHGPVLGPDGYYHLCWVWRDHGGCESNHDLCYARSRDLVHWETSAGRPLSLPLTRSTAEVVDPVPVHGGMLNGNTVIGFDRQGRVIISYHKFDPQGYTQLYNARLEPGGWRLYQVTAWDYRWDFQGGGAIVTEIGVGAVRPQANGSLTQSYRHPRAGSGAWRLDEVTLRPLGPAPSRSLIPPELNRAESPVPGMEVRWCSDTGRDRPPGLTYLLRWETLPANRDQPRATAPPPTMLKLYELKAG